MLHQNEHAFYYECEQSETGLTSFAGLPLYLELASKTGLIKTIQNTLQTKTQGWRDEEIILSTILLNLAGGNCIHDIERLEHDRGLKTLLTRQTQKERCDDKKRWHVAKRRAFPSNAALHRYFARFHSPEEEKRRRTGEAFIPQSNSALQALIKLNSTLIHYMQMVSPQKTATLDQDATLTKTTKRNAKFCYKKFKAYQPFNTYWAEQGMILHSEFRDGNVNAGYEQLRVFKEALSGLPSDVERVLLRSDSAGYQKDLLEYCAEGKDPRFGVIQFAIAAKVSSEVKNTASALKADNWQPVYKTASDGTRFETQQQWAEIDVVPSWVATKSRDFKSPYRYLVIREPFHSDPRKSHTKPTDEHYPFQTVDCDNKQYKLFCIITNRKMDANALIQWHRERCGHSEQVHSIQKEDFAGGQLPSNDFGVDAAWWHCMILALNLNRIMQCMAFPEELAQSRMKAIRYHVLQWSGKVVKHARQIIIRVAKEVYALYISIRQKISALPLGDGALDTS